MKGFGSHFDHWVRATPFRSSLYRRDEEPEISKAIIGSGSVSELERSFITKHLRGCWCFKVGLAIWLFWVMALILILMRYSK